MDMSGTLLALSLVSLKLNLDDAGGEETQCMLIVASQRTLLLIANNDDTVTEDLASMYKLRCSGRNLLDDAVSLALFNSPDSASKKLIYNKVREVFGPHTLERLKHKKFSAQLGHLKLDVPTSTGLGSEATNTTILVTGNDGSLQTVNGSVHAEQKLVAALERIKASNKLAIQEVWVAGCKRACNLCHDKLSAFRRSTSRGDYDFEFESPALTACQGSQRTAKYDT